MTTPNESAHALTAAIEAFISARQGPIVHTSAGDMAFKRHAIVAALEPLFANREQPQVCSAGFPIGPSPTGVLTTWPPLREQECHDALCRALGMHTGVTWEGILGRIKEVIAEKVAANARVHELQANFADTGRQLDAAIGDKKAAEARRMNLESDLANRDLVIAKLQREAAQPVIDAAFHPMPDGYRFDGPLVTNDTISVLATSEAVIIRTSTGVGCWAPLDAVKIAIAEKEKRT